MNLELLFSICSGRSRNWQVGYTNFHSTFIGPWEVRDSIENELAHWIVVPCLVLTFLFGPIGLLSYFGVRTIGQRLRNTKKL